MPEQGKHRQLSRGRVVILVDNDVRRDSRVQKQALSMAEAGWDVRLLGLAPPGRAQKWRLGSARVRLLPVTLNPRSYEARSPRYRDPFAYASTQRKREQVRRVSRRSVDLLTRRTAARETAARRNELARLWAIARFTPHRVIHRALSGWVQFRSQRTERVRHKRKNMSLPIDRLTTWTLVRLRGKRAWRQLDSHLWDLEDAYGPVIDQLEPDLIHANDFRMLGVGARAKMRAADRGRRVALVWDVHEFLPGTKPWRDHPRWHLAQLAHEREYANFADEVVTVSEELGDLLVKQHGLDRRPEVVLNCPWAPNGTASVPGVRDLCGLSPSTSLLVYCGAVSVQRGLLDVVEALPLLDGATLALVVSSPDSRPVRDILSRAEELGVAEQVHLLPYVAPEHVVDYLSSADLGLIPIHHYPNHEIALITKFFEYTHARLPIVVSDVRAMSTQVEATGQGEVFRAGDSQDLARAVREVLADPDRYRRAYHDADQLQRWTWEAQADVLDAVYQRALWATRNH